MGLEGQDPVDGNHYMVAPVRASDRSSWAGREGRRVEGRARACEGMRAVGCFVGANHRGGEQVNH